MKNYNFSKRILPTLFKWITLDITFRPEIKSLFKLSIDWKEKCSMPGLYINLTILRIFNLWISIFDERIFDEKTESLVDPGLFIMTPLAPEQIKCVDNLLGDLISFNPRFDQIFHRHDHLPDTVMLYKQQFSELFNDMEKYLRSVVSQKW